MKFKITDLTNYSLLSLSVYFYDYFTHPLLSGLGVIFWKNKIINSLISLGFQNPADYLIGWLNYIFDTLLGLTHNYFNFFIWSFSSSALIFSVKFLLLIALLVFIRGGVPRYRYDFLTKIGWIKFLSLILSNFTITLLLVMIF